MSNTLSFFLGVVLAFAAVQTAQGATAVYYNFKSGAGTEESPKDLRDTGIWTTNTGYNGNGISQEPKGQHNFNFGFASDITGEAWVYSSKAGKIADMIYTHTGHFVFKSGDFETVNQFYIGDTANKISTITKKDGAWAVGGNMHVGHNGSGTFVQDGGTVWVKNNKSLYVGNPGTGSLTVKSGELTVSGVSYIGRGATGNGTVTVNGGTVTFEGDCIFGDGGGTGILTINGGTVTVASGKWTKSSNATGTGTLNLNGGIFNTQHIQDTAAGSTINVNFNGGTLKANAANANGLIYNVNGGVSVTVGMNGGTIDTGAFNITIPTAVNAVENTTGAFTVTGGGSATFSEMGNLSGALTVGDSTTLRWFDQDSEVSPTCSFSSLALGAGSTIYLDADASGHDALPATVTTTATAENLATVKLIVRAMPASGQMFPLFAMDEADVNKVNIIAETPVGASIVLEKGYANGYLTYAIMAKSYVWNASQQNWNGTGAWDVDGIASDWADNNNAVFNTANAAATLAADVMAIKLDFRADATVAAGGGTLTVLEASVDPSVSATINAPTTGSLEKNGAGTLTLGSSRTDQTTLSEGALVMSGEGTTLDWTKFTFGTDPLKPVTLKFNDGATLANNSSMSVLAEDMDITLVKECGDWNVTGNFQFPYSAGTTAKFYHKGGTLTVSEYLVFGDNKDAKPTYAEISGGTVRCTSTAVRAIIASSSDATVVVKNKGALETAGDLLVANAAVNGTLTVEDGGKVIVADSIVFNYASADSVGIINLKRGGVLSAKRMYSGKGGPATCNFDGGTLIVTSNVEDNKLFSKVGGSGVVTVTVSEWGGTIDNGGNAMSSAIGNTITGEGGLTFTGTGATRVIADQAYIGTTTVSEGTTLSVANVTFAGSVSFAAGSKLNFESYTHGVAPLSASALKLPADGTVELTLNGGAFKKGVYIICSASGVSAVDGERFVPSTDGETLSWSVDGDRLLLTVGSVSGNFWTGLAGNNKMSDDGNWADGTAPEDGEDVDFSSILASTTIDADIANVTFGTVTMGLGPVVFTNDYMRATSFSDTSKVAVAPNSMVTLDGNLEFGTNVESYVCRYIYEGGKFVVTGNIIATSSQTGNIFPHVANDRPGSICVKGLVNDTSSSDVFYLVQKDKDRVANWQIGEGGISGSKRFILGHSGGGRVTITATADFAVSADIVQYSKLTLIPNGHKITLGTDVARHEGGILGGGANGLTTVSGPGKVVVNYDVTKLTSYTGSQPNAFKVASGGTLAIVSGANTSVSTDNKGMITVESGATLEVAGSGTVKLGCNHKFEDQAILKFNFTRRKEAPILNLADKTVEFGNNKSIKVSLSGVRPVFNFGGRWVLTTGGKFADVAVDLVKKSPDWVLGVGVENGEIYANIKPEGTRIVVR